MGIQQKRGEFEIWKTENGEKEEGISCNKENLSLKLMRIYHRGNRTVGVQKRRIQTFFRVRTIRMGETRQKNEDTKHIKNSFTQKHLGEDKKSKMGRKLGSQEENLKQTRKT